MVIASTVPVSMLLYLSILPLVEFVTLVEQKHLEQLPVVSW